MFLQNIAYTVLLLGVLVFVHELGHFLIAKWLGVKVLRFSIGFGPRIVGFTRGETEYRLSWLPLGGYVKMAGEQPNEELTPEEARRGFLAQSPWKRSLIIGAGPFANLAFPILAYFLIFFGTHQQISNRIGSVEPGLPAAQADLRPGDRILAVDDEKVQTFDELRTHLQPRYNRPIKLTVERDGRTFVATLTPAKTVDSGPIESVPRGMIGISPLPRPPAIGVPPGSPAEAVGLKTFDRIVSINRQPVKDELALESPLENAEGKLELQVHRSSPLELPGVNAQVPEVVGATLAKQPGRGYAALGVESVDLYVANVKTGSVADKAGIKRGDRLLELNGKELKSFLILSLALNEQNDRPLTLKWRSGTEVKTKELRQAKTEVKDEFGQASEVFDLGIRPWVPSAAEALDAERVTVQMGPVDALAASLRIVPEIIQKTAQVLGYLVTGRVPFKSLGGPIMLYQIASKSAEEGRDSFLHAMAVVSINLGLINILPIPVLDGFHLLAAAWEAIRRKPIPARAREIANMVGLAMLIVLMALVFKNDIMR